MKATNEIQILVTSAKGAMLITNGTNVVWVMPKQRREDGSFTDGAIKALDESNLTLDAYNAEQVERQNPNYNVANFIVVRESEKAIAISASTSFYCHIAEEYLTFNQMVWLPKSMIRDNQIAKWFVDKKVNELRSYIRGAQRSFHLDHN